MSDEYGKACDAITHQFLAIRGVRPYELAGGIEAAFGIDLTGLLNRLLDTLINQCFKGLSSAELAVILVTPSPAQQRALERHCWREARRVVRRPGDKNPTGQRITVRERNELREEVATDLFLALESTAQTAGFEACEALVDEMRVNEMRRR